MYGATDGGGETGLDFSNSANTILSQSMVTTADGIVPCTSCDHRANVNPGAGLASRTTLVPFSYLLSLPGMGLSCMVPPSPGKQRC